MRFEYDDHFPGQDLTWSTMFKWYMAGAVAISVGLIALCYVIHLARAILREPAEVWGPRLLIVGSISVIAVSFWIAWEIMRPAKPRDDHCDYE